MQISIRYQKEMCETKESIAFGRIIVWSGVNIITVYWHWTCWKVRLRISALFNLNDTFYLLTNLIFHKMYFTLEFCKGVQTRIIPQALTITKGRQFQDLKTAIVFLLIWDTFLRQNIPFGVAWKNEPWHEISNNVVCATSKGSDQPAHTRSLIRAFASRLHSLWILSY